MEWSPGWERRRCLDPGGAAGNRGFRCRLGFDDWIRGGRQQVVIRIAIGTYGAQGTDSVACARTCSPRRRWKRRQHQQDGQNAEHTLWFQVQN